MSVYLPLFTAPFWLAIALFPWQKNTLFVLFLSLFLLWTLPPGYFVYFSLNPFVLLFCVVSLIFFSCFFDDLRVVPGSSIHFIFNKERIYKKEGKKLSKNAIIRLGNNNERDKKAGDKREGALELCYRSRGRESGREREKDN